MIGSMLLKQETEMDQSELFLPVLGLFRVGPCLGYEKKLKRIRNNSSF